VKLPEEMWDELSIRY